MRSPTPALPNSYSVASGYGRLIPPKQALVLADQASQKALELDSSLPEAHTARAVALTRKANVERGRAGVSPGDRVEPQRRYRALLLRVPFPRAAKPD